MEILIEHIKKKYRKTQILRDISLHSTNGQMTGILGRNGTGKSTLLSILYGALSPDNGVFLYSDGRSTSDLLKNRALSSRLVGYVPQTTPLIEELSVLDNLRLWYTGGWNRLNSELKEGILSELKIEPYIHMKVSSLSGGMKKRLSIGCAIAHRPRILLLDEPGSALDLICKAIIDKYISNFRKAGGIVIIASHEIYEITSCSQTFILKDGILIPYVFDGDVKRLVSQF